MNDIAIMKILHNIVRERLGRSQLDARNIIISVLECMGYNIIVEHVLYMHIQWSSLLLPFLVIMHVIFSHKITARVNYIIPVKT